MLKQNLVECVGFNGFYPIPNFSRYMINKRGVVVVVNDLTEAVERIYLSAKECADDCGVKPTALSHRLKSNGKIIYRDNKTYRYYKQS